MVLINK